MNGKDLGPPDGLYAQPRQHFSIEASTPLAQHNQPPTQTYKYPCATIPLTQKSKPWASGWHPSLIVVGTIFLGMVVVDIIYFVYRIRYTLKTPTDPRDALGSSYSISAYPIISVIVELLCAVAMGLYAISKVFYPRVAWKPNAEQRALAAKAPVNVHICVCCCGEETEEVEVTMVKAAESLLYAGRMGYVNMECSGIWLCDDTGPSKKANATAAAGTLEKVQSDYEAVLPSSIRLSGKARPLKSAEIALAKENLARLMHGGKGKLPKQQQRMKLMVDLASNPKFDAVNFVQRYRDDPTPQVFKGVNYTIDILNHVNVEFWSTMMVSYNTTGFISCAGTNFAIKAAALRQLGPDPFPTHTVTEDFAMGMRLRAQKPPLTGIYLPVEYVSGGAPDTIRKAYRQRSRWAKGAWEMLFSKESALWYRRKSGPKNDGRNSLSFRDRISFLAPVFNVIVNATATPFLCFVPMFYILGGHFPASMTQATISLLITTLCFNLFFKYYGRPSVGVEHIVWKRSRPDPNRDVQFMAKVDAFDEDTKDGQMRVYKPRRETSSWFGFLMSEWNADQNIRCFWWLFMKVAVNSILVKLRFKARSGFKSTAGPAGEFFEGFMDVFPLTLLMLLLWACIVWGFLQFSLGATLIGPLGISMVWALYQSLPFFNQLLYVVCRVRHEPENIGCCGCYEHFGRKLFQFLYCCSFFITWAFHDG
ncbi:hypothetical protein WJX73_003018 [Symbiochloris irregularis]|uniref:Glycosyltransferase 2-like domain-containing protein n=1 Tax=Symbiochloris irregularis TaxID=706552 RepID=A0AAW1PUH9_9CHLO